MTASSACTGTPRAPDQNKHLASVWGLPPHPCPVETDIRTHSVGSVVCLLAQTRRQASHFPVRFPFRCVGGDWGRSRISVP